MKFSLKEALEGQPRYLVGVAYEMWESGNYEQDKPHDEGWELGYTPSTETDLQMIAGHYGIQPNDMELKTYWANEDASHDWMTNDETYYRMYVKHIDGSDLSQAERSSVNDLLNG